MAKGADLDEFRLVSGARSGCKREFAFIIKNQNDVTIPRTRGNNNNNNKSDPIIIIENEEKRLKSEALNVEIVKEETVEEENNNVGLLEEPTRRFTRSLKGEANVDEDDVMNNDNNSTPSKNKLEMKMSKKIGLMKFPSNVRELLETGLLEGLPVTYVFKNKKGEELRGTIKDRGILCSCATCQERQVVSPCQFERHAGSSNKHAPENIYMDNGNNLRHVLTACLGAPLDTLEATIKSAISSCPETQMKSCKNCKEPLSTSITTKTRPFCDSCFESNAALASASHVHIPNGRLSKPISTPKSSASASERISSVTKSKPGKLTRKDLRLHKVVFEEDGLPDGTELGYYIRGEVSASQFESHAGWASRRKPYLNIYTSNGVSLHELAVSLSKGRKLSNHYNDDLCSYCADFGDLMCCDMCPRAFHQECVGLSSIPQGKWYCPYCLTMFEREKSCEYNANAKAAGRVSGIDPIEQITRRCIRIVETLEFEVGGCALCRRHSFSKSGFNPSTVILCDQCEREYHVGCLKEHKMADLKELPKGKWFCCTDCNRIHTALQKLVAHGPEKLPDSLLKVMLKKQQEKCPDNVAGFDVSWRLLSGKMASPENKLLLSKAVTILHNQFDPILDAKTGCDFIPTMVYGRSIKDQDFGGMYCAVLTVNSTVVTVAILRIFGPEIAEIPLVATTSDNQGLGYFQSLFTCIERLLGFLNVKNIVLPSAEESKSIWTDKFGFKKISPDQVSEYRNNYQMMTFHGTSMLQRPVPKCRVVDTSIVRS
ncbi:hypothetical protein IFM89_033367 [Coptis chinensis]|uniref:PHD-type domain-containing protein n=1 Tax=Coptis chinensis TaxID=261450 RepID=A0A835HIM4_9MAGN|nr:hypothetical protein IFM89_033367 [Coptis chinensis]